MFLKCVEEGKDQYKRILAECFVNNSSLSSYLVKEGYAFAYRKYSKKFVPDENYARSNNLGMWSMKFEYPWDWSCLLYTSPSPRDLSTSRMPSSA